MSCFVFLPMYFSVLWFGFRTENAQMKNQTRYTFPTLIASLSENASLVESEASKSPTGKQVKEVTSIRLEPEVRAYLHAQSQALGISVSQIIGIILKGVIEQSSHDVHANDFSASDTPSA